MATDWTARIRLRHLKIMLSLAETGNLSRSASLLNTTQPALSKWLRELEVDMGLTLFERHARGLQPTSHGKALIEHAQRIVTQLDRAVMDMAILRDGGAGRVVIGMSGAAAPEAAPQAVLSMARRLPDIRVDLQEGTMDQLLSQLSQGDLDIVIGRTVGDSLGAPDVNDEMLYVEPVELVARVGHPLFVLPTVGWDDVLAYRWIVWPQHTPIRAALEASLAAAGRVLPERCMESNSVTANIALINNSNFIGNASRRTTTVLTKAGVLRVVPLSLDSFGSVSMYWRNSDPLPKSVQQTLQCIRDVAKDGTAR